MHLDTVTLDHSTQLTVNVNDYANEVGTLRLLRAGLESIAKRLELQEREQHEANPDLEILCLARQTVRSRSCINLQKLQF